MGLFIQKGMTISIDRAALERLIRGNASEMILKLGLNIVPAWVQIALDHARRARLCERRRNAAWIGDDDARKVRALSDELQASMQAIVAAATAIDALFALLRPTVAIPEEMTNRWKTNRTARHTQVAEVIRRAFGFSPKATAALKNSLRQLYRLRDWAVHPPADSRHPLPHPDLKVFLEWRFVWFRAQNAVISAEGVASLIWELTEPFKPVHRDVEGHMKVIRSELSSVIPKRIQRRIAKARDRALAAKAGARRKRDASTSKARAQ